MKIGVIDFFCGCGGTSAGLQASGMEILGGVDLDTIALKTYARNFPKAKIFNQDITKMKTNALKAIVDEANCNYTLFAACAPCQPFSTQNKSKDSSLDARSTLLDEFHRFIKHFKPDFIVLENVPGLQKIEAGPLTRFTKLLDKLEYFYDVEVKDAKDYGVPQTRKRLVLIASRHQEIKLPTQTHGLLDDQIDYETVWKTIKKYPAIHAGQTHKNIANHQCANLNETNLQRLRATPEGGDRRHWPKNLIVECHKGHTGHTDTYGRLSKNKPAVTLTTRCISLSNGRYGHPVQDRALSVREAAALQTFSDDFVFEGTLNQAARQVGNAVPVLFAKKLGDAIKSQARLLTKAR